MYGTVSMLPVGFQPVKIVQALDCGATVAGIFVDI
jgi:hypothetical protein